MPKRSSSGSQAKPSPALRLQARHSSSGLTEAQLDAAVARIKAMSSEELVQSLKDTGILTPTGKLAKRYRSEG